MSKNTYIVMGIITLIALVSVIAIYQYKDAIFCEKFLKVSKLYDADGNEIGNTQSVVSGVEGVKYITLKITATNKDTVPLDLKVKSITPTDLQGALPLNTKKIEPDKSAEWETELIDIEPYEGTVQEFCITVESLAQSSLREASEISGCIDVKVDPNPSGAFEIDVGSSISDGNINPGCDENWECSQYGECMGGQQERTCTDINDCGTTENKPSLSQVCEVEVFQTNAINGDYDKSDVWIEFNGNKYTHYGRSTYSCLSENIIIETPEGYDVCSRPGYDVSQRVYLNGIIFRGE